jgi:hypothetical protein
MERLMGHAAHIGCCSAMPLSTAFQRAGVAQALAAPGKTWKGHAACWGARTSWASRELSAQQHGSLEAGTLASRALPAFHRWNDRKPIGEDADVIGIASLPGVHARHRGRVRATFNQDRVELGYRA